MHRRSATSTPLIERAYELARSGDCRNAADISDCLVAEGYYLGSQLEQPALKKDLLRVCQEAPSGIVATT